MPSPRLDSQASVHEKLDRLLEFIATTLRRLDAIKLAVAQEPVAAGRLYTRAESARLMRTTVRAIDRLIKGDPLQAVRRGRQVLVTGDSLRSLFRDERRGAAEVQKL